MVWSRVFLGCGCVLGVCVFPVAAGASRHGSQKADALVDVGSAITQVVVAARVRGRSMWRWRGAERLICN